MADHVHRQIRDALATALGGLATTGTNVFPNRIAPVPDGKLPALCIFADDESSENISSDGPAAQQRTLVVIVEARDKGATVDDTLDQISKEVEVALSGGLTVGGRHLDLTYTGMQFDDTQAEKPAAIKRMRFSVSFFTHSNSPDTFA